MEVKIRVTGEEVVKPSSLTPDQLRFYPFSFIDQIALPYFIPFLGFFENKTNVSNGERADHLKTSLSQILSHFYPLAGRIKKNKTGVDCNDEGVRFVEAKADCKMSQIFENPNSYDLNRFLTFEYQEESDVPLKVQLTFFDCGGLALGLGLSHKLSDGLSCFTFIKNWTAVARGNTHDLITPRFDLAKLFPPTDMGGFNAATGNMNQNIVTKRFVFSKSSIESLRERISGSKKEFKATRVEALSGFIWSRYIASKAVDVMGKMYAIIHPVDLRRFGDGIIPENMFGNIVRVSVTILEGLKGIKEDEERSSSVVQQMREGIRKIDKDYVKKLHEDSSEQKEVFIKNITAFITENIETFVFTSLRRVPVYELDFGWGKPSWIACGTICFKNLVAFLDTKEDDGIEAWVNMEEKDMSRFESDEELLSYVTSIEKCPILYSRI